MKITKEGVPPNQRIWHGTCRKCGSEAEAERSELENVEEGDYRSGGPFSWEECPVCHAGPFGGMLFYPKKKESE